MTTSEQYWVHQQLEPEDILKGNSKRFKDIEPKKSNSFTFDSHMTDKEIREDNKKQDKFLQSKGIDINPKQ